MPGLCQALLWGAHPPESHRNRRIHVVVCNAGQQHGLCIREQLAAAVRQLVQANAEEVTKLVHLHLEGAAHLCGTKRLIEQPQTGS